MTANASKTVIFDFDGTIADSFFLVAQGYKEFASRLGITNPVQFDLQELRNYSAGEIIKKYKISMWKLWKLTPELWKYMNKKIDKVKPIPGMVKVIQRLYELNLRLMIVTSNSKENVKDFLHRQNLDYFEEIYSKRSILGKADKIAQLTKFKKLNKDSVFYVGDEVRDIEAAKKVNIKIIAVTWGYNSKQALQKAKPDFLISKPGEILKVVENY